jgi:hypothetical protein
MKIWQVTRNDTQTRFDWFVTKKEAEQFVTQARADYKHEEYGDDAIIEMESVEVEATRAGIVKALNHVISLTCFNEG